LSYKTEWRPLLAREEKKKRRGPESFKFLTASEDIKQPLLHHYLTVSLSFQPFLMYGSKTDLATVAITNSITIYQPLLLPSAHPMFSHLKKEFQRIVQDLSHLILEFSSGIQGNKLSRNSCVVWAYSNNHQKSSLP
jgi:hypothetical protein